MTIKPASITLPAKPRIASFDVDPQYTFTPVCPEELPVPDGEGIVSALNQQASFASLRLLSKEAHSPHALWVADENHPALSAYHSPDKNLDVYWPIHAVPGTKGFQHLQGLPPVTDYDFVVWKGVELDLHPYGACYHDLQEKLSTGVIEFLRYHEINTVLVGGLATDYCVKNTALQLTKAQFTVILNLAACRGIDPATTQQAIEGLQQTGVLVIDDCHQLKTK